MRDITIVAGCEASPKHKIPVAQRPGIVTDKSQEGPDFCTPKSDFSRRPSRSYSFGSSRRFEDTFEEKKSTPGPGADTRSPSLSRVCGGFMANGPRGLENSTTSSQGPGPGEYAPQGLNSTLSRKGAVICEDLKYSAHDTSRPSSAPATRDAQLYCPEGTVKVGGPGGMSRSTRKSPFDVKSDNEYQLMAATSTLQKREHRIPQAGTSEPDVVVKEPTPGPAEYAADRSAKRAVQIDHGGVKFPQSKRRPMSAPPGVPPPGAYNPRTHSKGGAAPQSRAARNLGASAGSEPNEPGPGSYNTTTMVRSHEAQAKAASFPKAGRKLTGDSNNRGAGLKWSLTHKKWVVEGARPRPTFGRAPQRRKDCHDGPGPAAYQEGVNTTLGRRATVLGTGSRPSLFGTSEAVAIPGPALSHKAVNHKGGVTMPKSDRQPQAEFTPGPGDYEEYRSFH